MNTGSDSQRAVSEVAQDKGSPEDTDDAAKLIADGHLASALLSLRETLWVNWHSNSEPFYEECALLMKDTYMKMGRPLFAHRVQQQINYMRTLGF